MVYVYILKSSIDNGYYIGICKDLKNRIDKHNRGSVYSTRKRRPLKLIRYERFFTYKGAGEIEKELKSFKGGNKFKKIIS